MRLRACCLACAAGVALFGGPARPESGVPARTHVWARWETALRSARTYADPCRDVAVRATFTGPKGQVLRAFGFWDGGVTFRVRCAFRAEGFWRWRTECSDAENAGLHGRSGEVRVRAYAGRNPLYRHGFLRVSGNGRYLCHADGTPFLWMGDTAWAGPLHATPAEWETYLADRARKRFSVIQVALAPWWAGDRDAAGNRPFLGEGLARPNPAFWQAYESKIQAANAKGLAVLVVGVMEPTTRYPKEEEARAFARCLAARLFGSFVLFSPSFDSPYMPLGDAVGQALREATAAHLITQHPGTPSGRPANTFAEVYRDRPYLDFAGDQTGHNGGDRERCARQAMEWNLSLWRRQPPKPVVNLEAMYDSHDRDAGTADDARSLGWRSWLSGAMGYTYGGGLWGWVADPAATDYWRAAMAWPSSDQMTVLRDFLAGIPWWRLEPAHELALDQPAGAVRRAPLAATPDRRLAVAYLPDGDGLAVDMASFPGPVTARWFDPVRGRFMPVAGSFPGAGAHRFQAPARGEWVLELRSAGAAVAGARAGPPGGATALGVRDAAFTLGGRPVFLLGFSYYGAAGASGATWKTDLDAMHRRGFNWLRVWATWNAYGNDVSAVDGEGRPREPYLRKLRTLVRECDRRGMVVDVTLTRGPGLIQTFEAHRRAVETLLDALGSSRNWYLDLSNERNIRDARYTPVADLARLRDLVKQRDPGRLVTASWGGDIDREELRACLLEARLDFVCPHRPRDAASPGQTEAKTREYLAWMREIGRVVPVHYQEPFRRGYGAWQPRAEDFAADLRGARTGGAAGWCFHNGGSRGAKDERPRRSFDLRDGPLTAQLDAEERRFVQELPAPPGRAGR